MSFRVGDTVQISNGSGAVPYRNQIGTIVDAGVSYAFPYKVSFINAMRPEHFSESELLLCPRNYGPFDLVPPMPSLEKSINKPFTDKEVKPMSLLEKLLNPDLAIVKKYYFDYEGNLRISDPDVQKAIYSLIEKDLIVAAKARKEDEKCKK